VTRRECSKQAAGNIHCARGEVVLTCECVVCVGNYILTTTTAETTGSFRYIGGYLVWRVQKKQAGNTLF